MARLTADLWVSAYLTRLRLSDIPAFVTRKGDATAGAVMVKLNTLDGQAKAFQREFNILEDRRDWAVLAEGDERDVDAALSKQASFDPDLWIIEVEDRQGRSLLDEPGLSD
ncbi:DUF1491 family protein [Celeribacter litoreus]|uniref:DUF1491 family protein n=1 Tax=Celeribacter litoreus TaxID=2876714 RepID=UPI001CC97CB1|nr:DUF1491 family protein [Celeribacter litoreus]MCA0042368.1 DUF1491 family protein [Celeribacter litoreus]